MRFPARLTCRLLLIVAGLTLPVSLYGLDVSVEIDGLDRAGKENVSAFLSIEQEKGRKELSVARLRLLHKKANEEIRQALQPFGYFKPQIESELRQTGQAYRAIYRITPGPLIRLSEVDVQILGEGSDDPELAPDFPLKKGDVLNQPVYEEAKQKLLTRVIEQGYLDAAYSLHKITVNMAQYTAQIDLRLNTGRKFRFGQVQFSQEVMDPAFLARYVSFAPGDPFSHEKLLNLQSSLIDSEYFSHVEILTLRDKAEGDRVPIEVICTPSKRDRYRVGVGYSTDTGPRLTLDWKRRRVGPNGQRLSGQLQLSRPYSTLNGEYLIPLEHPAKDALTYGFTLDNYDTDSRQGNLALVNVKHSVGLEDGWRRNLRLDASYEDFDVADQPGTAFLLAPSIQFSRIKSDGLAYIQRGQHLDFRLEGASEKLLSSVTYLQFYTYDKFIYGLGDGDWRLFTRAELGATQTQNLLDLPASKRFFAGGDNSIRGYDLDQLGPEDAEGLVVGGRYLAVASLELVRHLVGKWSGAIFVDAGNAFDPDYPSQVAYGTGFGVRWQSPVGPVRVDLAFGLSLDDLQTRLHIVFGPEL
ncbi:MAG: autotransporter assembly complex family protein [Chromatiales bacterium]